MGMSEELKRFVDEAVYKYIKKQIQEGKYIASLRIEIDQPIEIKGMKGRIVGEIVLASSEPLSNGSPTMTYEPAKKDGKEQQQVSKRPQEEEMSMQEVEKILKSLGV